MVELSSVLSRLWGARPTTHSPMMNSAYYEQTGRKYVRRHSPLTGELLAAHLAGEQTLAAPLIGPDDLAHCWAVELDTGGIAACAAALQAAQICGLVAVAFVGKGAGGHDGGHVWSAPYNRGYDPARLRAAACQVVAIAQLPEDTETWPTRADLRLPFGRHTHTGQRGRLLLQDGTIYDLDTPEGFEAGLTIWAALAPNTLPPPTIEPEIRPLGAPRPVQLDSGSTIRSWARNVDLVSLLEGYGARKARSQPKEGTLLHCPCGGHPHGDKRASLLVKPGRDGTPCAIGYAPGCAYATQNGKRYDAGAVVCHQEGISYKDLYQRISSSKPAAQRASPLPIAPPESLTPEQLAQREEENARKREARREAAAATLATYDILTREDTQLAHTPRLLLAYLIDQADGTLQCCPTNPEIATALGKSERTCQRAFRQLEARGIGKRTGGYNDPDTTRPNTPAVWTFFRVTFSESPLSCSDSPPSNAPPTTADLSPFFRSCDLDSESSVACEAGGVAVAPIAPVPAVPQQVPAIAEVPQLPAPITEPGGASYDPAADWTAHPELPARLGRGLPTEAARLRIAEQERQQRMREAWERQQVEQATAVAAVEQPQLLDQAGETRNYFGLLDQNESTQRAEILPAAPSYGPPSDPATRRRYFALKGKARTASSGRQREYLEGLARDLEELQAAALPGVGAASPAGRASPPRFTSQLQLFAGASP